MTQKDKSIMKLDLARAWQESGLTQTDFARANNMKLGNLRYWIRKLRSSADGMADFVQLNGFTSGGISIRYPSGVEITLPAHTPAALIRSLINI